MWYHLGISRSFAPFLKIKEYKMEFFVTIFVVGWFCSTAMVATNGGYNVVYRGDVCS